MITRISGGIVLLDICDKLPHHKTKKYVKRDISKLERIYIHHSGILGTSGIDGPINSAKYIINRKNSPFPGAPYHFWIPFESVYTDYNSEKWFTIYRLQPDEVRCYHTGGQANSHGIGVVLQGNTSTYGMSDYQVECMEGLIPWLLERFELQLPDGLSYHAEAHKFGGKVKPSCPGTEAVEWINKYRLSA